MNLELIDKNALVGGSSQGIGKAAAIELAALGADVTLVARNEDRLREVLAELDTSQGQNHDFLILNYNHAKDVRQSVADYIEQHQKPFHILVNNTGGPPAGPIVEAEIDAFLQALNNHLVCNHLLAQTVLEGMKSEGYGRIINVISTSVKSPLNNLGVSNTTRGAVASWAKTWSNEVGKFGITVNNVLPGFTNTQRLNNIIFNKAEKQDKSADEVIANMKSNVPLQRFAEPAEVGAVVAFLASPAAGYINGVSLRVDGGRTKGI